MPRGAHASKAPQDSMVWLWASWREICVANAGEPVSMTAETANSVAIVLRRIPVGAEAVWVIAELLLALSRSEAIVSDAQTGLCRANIPTDNSAWYDRYLR